MRRGFFVGLFGLLVAVALALPAKADTDQDREFIAELKAAGWTISNPSLAISQGHMVCGEGLSHGVTWQEILATHMSWGFSRLDASTLIRKAVAVYCPEFSGAIAGIGDDVGKSASGGPTRADAADFTKEVYDHGILRNRYPIEIEQMLADICYKNKEFSSSGIPTSYIATLYMNSYGLSKKDANWLINNALDKCN